MIVVFPAVLPDDLERDTLSDSYPDRSFDQVVATHARYRLMRRLLFSLTGEDWAGPPRREEWF